MANRIYVVDRRILVNLLLDLGVILFTTVEPKSTFNGDFNRAELLSKNCHHPVKEGTIFNGTWKNSLVDVYYCEWQVVLDTVGELKAQSSLELEIGTKVSFKQTTPDKVSATQTLVFCSIGSIHMFQPDSQQGTQHVVCKFVATINL